VMMSRSKLEKSKKIVVIEWMCTLFSVCLC
jgi:hypothetical protein